MKRIKIVLDFIISLVAVWKIVIPVLAVLISVVVLIGKSGLKIIAFSLPVWVVFILLILASYPIIKFIEHIIRHRKRQPIALYGLLWKPMFFNFRYPQPTCPHDNCECEVICKEIPPQSYQVVSSMMELKNARFEYRYVYECPIHGALPRVPNEDISLLQYKAKKVMKK